MLPANDNVAENAPGATLASTRIERVLQVKAKPETVFALLTDAEECVRWMGTQATLEPHAGGL